MPCAERATGVVRSTATYQPDQPWPAEQADVGGYTGRGGWPWAGVSVESEVGVEAQLSRRPLR